MLLLSATERQLVTHGLARLLTVKSTGNPPMIEVGKPGHRFSVSVEAVQQVVAILNMLEHDIEYVFRVKLSRRSLKVIDSYLSYMVGNLSSKIVPEYTNRMDKEKNIIIRNKLRTYVNSATNKLNVANTLLNRVRRQL